MDLYQVLEQVGEGAYGRVFKGRRKHVGQVVALKFIPKGGRSEKELQGLKREIEIMRGLRHPHIVQLFDSFETSAEVVVVTEYLEGQLFQILEDDGNLPESQVREMACQLLSALHYLHSHRILHRDMKPQNIVLGKSGVVKLCDFGFSRAMSASTMVLTSFKGSPLYMSPEMVEGKPYDQTADLWSLGVILYELHTGVPPFNANSIYTVMQLITKGQVKWPNTMSDACMSFLKGLLTKDPQKRLAWPDILHHPFVADRVSDAGSYSPLTARLSPDMQALKLQQIAAKMQPNLGESVLMQKAREYDARTNRGSEKVMKNGWEQEKAALAEESPKLKSPFTPLLASGHQITAAATRDLYSNTQALSKTKPRGQISIDYDREFPSVEVRPQPVRGCSQNANSEEFWEKVAQDSDPSSQQKGPVNPATILPHLKSKLLAFKAQLTGGNFEGVCILQPLKFLRNLILTSDPEKTYEIGQKLGLPHVLFDLVQSAVDNPSSIKKPESVPALGEILIVLLLYWEKHQGWAREEQSLGEFTGPLSTILHQPKLLPVAHLAAAVLSLFLQCNVDIKVDMDNLTFLLKNLLLDSDEPQISPPPGWGICDGLLSLLSYSFLGDKRSSGPSFLDPSMIKELWKRTGASLEKPTPDTTFCSANGLYSFLSATLFIFTKDPYSCVPLFSDCESRCLFALGRLLGTDCRHVFAAVSPDSPEETDVSHDSVSALSCQLLMIPFALDLPSHAASTIIQLYDSCGIVTSLLQVIQTFPALQLELPLSLLSRLLLCDPSRSVFHLRKCAGAFFSPPRCGQSAGFEGPSGHSRTASSLLSQLLQLDELWDSAVELLILLSQIACFSDEHSHLELCLEASVLHRALRHSHCQIKATACRLLGNINPFGPSALHTLQPTMFKSMIDCLGDCCVPVRRMACRAVGNWLGYVAVGLKSGWHGDQGGSESRQSGQKSGHGGGRAGDMAATLGEAECEWKQEARRAAGVLVSLISDSDTLTRRHCCEALGNLRHVDGTLPLLLAEDVFVLLLRAACADNHNAVRRAAMATLSLYCKQDKVRQVLKSHNASEKLLKALRHTPPHCDFHQLIEQL